MKYERIFLDTAYVQALLNKKDKFHEQAKLFFKYIKTAKEVWITEAVLIEIGNALSKSSRKQAVQFINNCYDTKNIHVVNVSTQLLKNALVLYEKYSDKQWGLVDCISISVMYDKKLTIAFTTDKHFIQAGFKIVLN